MRWGRIGWLGVIVLALGCGTAVPPDAPFHQCATHADLPSGTGPFRIRWARVFATPAFDEVKANVDASGDVLAVVTADDHGEQSAKLVKLDGRNGETVWTDPLSRIPTAAPSTVPDATDFFLSIPALDGYNDSALEHYACDGTDVGRYAICVTDGFPLTQPVRFDPARTIYGAACYSPGGELLMTRLRWRSSRSGFVDLEPGPSGSLYAAAAGTGPLELAGRSFGVEGKDTFVMLRLTPAQEIAWAQAFVADSIDPLAARIVVSGDGRAIASGMFVGHGEWGTTPLDNPEPSFRDEHSFVLATDPIGTPTWASTNIGYSPVVGQSGAGYVAQVHDMKCGSQDIVPISIADGSRATPLTLATAECDWSGVVVQGIAVSPNGDAIVFGSFTGTIDFGAGPVRGDADGFVLRLGRE